MTRDTVGKLSADLNKNAVDNTHSAHEQMKEQLSEYDYNLFICLKEAKKHFYGDFFVVVTTKKERLMQNVIRNYFFARNTCPTPEWDQTVYRYDHQSGDVFFLWVIPAKDVCQHIVMNALTLPPEERQLLEFVMQFHDGTLLKRAKKFNNEQDDSSLLIT